MATGENSSPETARRGHAGTSRAGRISTGAVAAFALTLTLGLFAVHAATRERPARTLYIALGDSYAAGPGIPTQVDIPSGCERSSHSYPVLVADHLALNASQFRDASCSSAKIADLAAPQSTGSATDPPQLSALSADATLVTLGIGGNDLDFSGILTRCVELDALGVLVAEAFHATDKSRALPHVLHLQRHRRDPPEDPGRLGSTGRGAAAHPRPRTPRTRPLVGYPTFFQHPTAAPAPAFSASPPATSTTSIMRNSSSTACSAARPPPPATATSTPTPRRSATAHAPAPQPAGSNRY